MLNDIRYAIRTLRKTPGFTAVAVLALAVGIGANTAIFSVVNGVLLRSLPYEDPGRLVMIWSDNPKVQIGIRELPSSVGDYADIRKLDEVRHTTTFNTAELNLTGEGDPYRVAGVQVANNFFETFGVAPMLGRTFRSEEQKRGNAQVVILSHALWTTRFGARRDVIGSKVSLGEMDHTIVGVMPPEFTYPRGSELPKAYGFAPATELWIPRVFTPDELQRRNNRSYPIVARLKEVASIDQLNSSLKGLAARVQRENPEWKDWGFRAEPFRDSVVGRVESLILVMSLAVAFVLLIACANVANLLLSRAASRSREIAVRVALGAGRVHIIRQVLAESMILSLAGGIIGAALGAWGVYVLIQLAPKDIPRLQETSVDSNVLLFTLAVSLVTALLFGIAPALQSSRTGLNEALKEGSRGTDGHARSRMRAVLTVAEVAMAVMLLFGAGLLIRSFVRLYSIDPGFRANSSLVTMNLATSRQKYENNEKVIALYDQLLARVESQPGVEVAGAISTVPLWGTENLDIFVPEGMPDPGRGGEMLTDDSAITPGYFRVMGIPLLAGRHFDSRDTADSPPVVIVNETLAKTFFPSGAVGKRIKMGRFNDKDAPWREIVGVVKDVKQSSLQSDPRPQVYGPLPQRLRRDMNLVVKTSGSPAVGVEAVRTALREIDPRQPIGNIRTMEQVVSDSVSRPRFTMLLLAVFAGIAMVLAAIGLYGVLSYTVAQRTREIGVRMALGAGRKSILQDVLGRTLAWVATGVVFGILGSLAAGRLMSSLLYGVSPWDVVNFAAVIPVLVAICAIAAWIPARRATKVDPMVALRWE